MKRIYISTLVLAAVMVFFAAISDAKETTYTVKKGDTLNEIAYIKFKDYGITMSQIQEWNGIGTRELKPGDVLRIIVPEEVDMETAVKAGASAAANAAADKFATQVGQTEKKLVSLLTKVGIVVCLVLVLGIAVLFFNTRTTRGTAIPFKMNGNQYHFYPLMRKGKFVSIRRKKPTLADILLFKWLMYPLYDKADDVLKSLINTVKKDEAILEKLIRKNRVRLVRAVAAIE